MIETLDVDKCEDVEQGLVKREGKLALNNLKLVDITPLSGLRNLRSLNLARNNISIYSSFKSEKLESLDLSINSLEELDLGLIPVSLQILNVSQNKIILVKGAEKADQLKSLNLSSNRVVNLETVEQLKNLEKLFLGQNRIEKIDSLKNLKKLKYLVLSGNQITEIGELKALVNLVTLSVSDNPFLDFQCPIFENEVGDVCHY